MKKTVGYLIFCIVLALGTGSALAGTTQNYAKVATILNEVKEKKAVSFLFILSAKTGTVSKNQTGGDTLGMNLQDVDQVIAYSGGSARIITDISAQKLKQIWALGSNSFVTDPPNAILTVEGKAPVIVVLTSYTVNGNHVSFSLKPAKAGVSLSAERSKRITLAIDSSAICGNPCPSSFSICASNHVPQQVGSDRCTCAGAVASNGCCVQSQ